MGRYAVPLLIGIVGCAILVALGLWQVQRLAWKEGVLADIDARIAAAPVPVPDTPDPVADRFLPVTATGEITDQEIHVLFSLKGVGPAYRIISLFITEDDRRLLLDRGYVRPDELNAPRPAGTATVTGNLHWPDEVDSFTPEPDRAGNIWFARDVREMSLELATEPLLIVARATSETDPGVTPLPLDSGGIPNDHLEYAVTWFGLAAVWAGMTLFWIMRLRRGRG